LKNKRKGRMNDVKLRKGRRLMHRWLSGKLQILRIKWPSMTELKRLSFLNIRLKVRSQVCISGIHV